MSDPLSKEARDALRALAAEATPGPWVADPDGHRWIGMGAFGVKCPWGRDANYIAALSPEVVLALLDRIEALEAERLCGCGKGEAILCGLCATVAE